MEVLEMRRKTVAAWGLVIMIGLAILAAGGVASAGAGAGSLVTARIDDRTVHFSPTLHAGFVQLHIVSTGSTPHHLLFWQLHRTVSFKQFDRVDASQNGNPFPLATLVGGNGQLSPGHTMDIWIHVAKGRIAIDDVPAGPGPGFHLDVPIRSSGQNARQPKALGTVAAVPGDHYRLPPGFGRPGVWKFTNRDNAPQEAMIIGLAAGKTAADVISWVQHGKKGPPPISSADGGFGALGGHSHAWFTIGHLPAGHYAVVSFVPGANGVPQVAMGMAAGFTVR
jgi:hypothetical protein